MKEFPQQKIREHHGSEGHLKRKRWRQKWATDYRQFMRGRKKK